MSIRTRIRRTTLKVGNTTSLSRLRIVALVASLASAALFTVDASAYTRMMCNGKVVKRSSSTVTLNASATFGTSGGWLTPLNAAFLAANENPSKFLYVLTTGDGSISMNNGQNEIWWDTQANIGGSAARTFVRVNCSTGFIWEADIVFAVDITTQWTASNALSENFAFGGSRFPFIQAAIHEMGHVAGLDHTADTYSVMGQQWSHVHVNGNQATPYFGADASRGLVDIFGPVAVILRDVSVTNMHWTGSSGGYSVHEPTLITTSSGSSMTMFRDANGVKGYRVNKGQAVNAEFVFENLGNQPLTNVRFDYYISNDNVITSSDTNVSAGILAINPVSMVPINWPITIPSNLVSGQTYYLGVIVDSNKAVAEFTESNNYTYIPIRIN